MAAGPVGAAVDLVVDGGALTEVPSTLVNVAVSPAVVEREGAIAREAIAIVLAGGSGGSGGSGEAGP